jgi:hypothetical protein
MSDDSRQPKYPFSEPGSERSALGADAVRALLDARGLIEVVGASRRATLIADLMRAADELEEAQDDVLRVGRLAQALERFALALPEGEDRERLFDEAFICRRAISVPDLPSEERLVHLMCLAADGLEADRRPDLIMALRSMPALVFEIPGDAPWPRELLWRVARAFVLVSRRDHGWDDLTEAADEIAGLRALQAAREDQWAETADLGGIAQLVVLYNLARMAELTAEFSVSGTPADITVRLDRHHENMEEILEQAPDALLTHVSDLLYAGALAVVRASVWTTTRTLGAHIRTFVDALAAAERDNPVLELWPSQRSALRSSLLDPAKRALVVQMPTSSGKTLIAEFAIVQALALNPGSKVAYVVPTRALVNQIARRLRLDFSGLGYSVEAAVPVFELDPIEDEFLRGRQVDVLVTTPEKLDLLVRQDHPSAANISLVVADEAHNLAIDDRGARLELLLATLKRERDEARFLLLSPFTPNAADLAEWLGDDPAAAVRVNWKPTEVVTAVATLERSAGNRLRMELRTLPSARDLELGVPDEVRIDLGPAVGVKRQYGQVAARASRSLSGRGGVLILCRGRGFAEKRAADIAGERDPRKLSELGEAVAAFAEAEMGPGHPLAEQVRRGVCFHHAGVSHDLRYLLERLIDLGDVDVVCGTSTLAQGVNFPIASVVLETLQRKTDGPEVWTNLSYAEFWNVAGRAGRALRDRVGLVAYAAPTEQDVTEFRDYLRDDAVALASALLGAVETLHEAETEFGLKFIADNRVLGIFTQYVAHALRVGGVESARADVEDLLRSSLVYSQARAKDPEAARRLIRLARAYIDKHAGKSAGWLRLADGTGFSLESVGYLFASQRSEHPELRDVAYWSPTNLFTGDGDQLTSLIGVIGNIPEISLGEESRGPFHPGLVADVVRDWVDGHNVTEIANRRFATLEPDPVKRVQRAGRYLHTKLVSQVPWGMGALQRLALANVAQEASTSVAHVPSLVFYGVRTREAAALRMAGVPRVAAEGLGHQMGTDPSLADLAEAREWVAARDSASWQSALPAESSLSGSQARLIWAELAATPA